jgi:hypothetical protein
VQSVSLSLRSLGAGRANEVASGMGAVPQRVVGYAENNRTMKVGDWGIINSNKGLMSTWGNQ